LLDIHEAWGKEVTILSPAIRVRNVAMRGRSASALALLTSIASSLLGQSTIELTGVREQAGTCTACTMVAKRVAELGSLSDSELVPDEPVVTILPDGRFLVGNAEGGPILIYSRAGQYVGTLGRIGNGPGEYHNARHMFAGPADSVTVIGSNLFAVISTKTGRGRSMPFAGRGEQGYVRLQDGGFVLNTTSESRKAFTLLDRQFREQATFGSPAPGNANGDRELPLFALSASRLGGFWAAKREFVHRIERWSMTGTVVQRLDSLPVWFKPYTEADARPPGGFRAYVTRPVPRMWAINEQANGQLWVVTILPDRNWTPVPNAPQFKTLAEYRSYVPPPDPDRHLDSIIEVFTAQTGRLLGSWRFHEPLEDFLENGTMYSRQQLPDGGNRIQVWKLSLGNR
jgi:hypothetical protein